MARINISSLIVSLLSTINICTVDAANGSYCGKNYDHAMTTCSSPDATPIPCDTIGMDSVNCPMGYWCFGPNLPCAGTGAAAINDVVDAAVAGVSSGNAGAGDASSAAKPTVAGGSDNPMLELMMLASSSSAAAADVNDGNGTSTNNGTSAEGNNANIPTYSPTANATSTTYAPTVSSTEDDDEPDGTNTVQPTAEPTVEGTLAPTTERFRFANERRGQDNPANHYCGTGWDHAKTSCNTDPHAVPCPRNLPCPSGEMCFAMGLLCIPITATPTETPTNTPTTSSPTTPTPTASPISAADPANAMFCGTDEEDARENCSSGRRAWCRSGTDGECPDDQLCFDTTPSSSDVGSDGVSVAEGGVACNATAFGYSLSPTALPTVEPTTPMPTEDLNPLNRYCAPSWRDSSYDGDCGVPCPGGSHDECPENTYCYPNQDNCIQTYKAGVSTSWCGKSFNKAAETCHQECPNGQDDECPNGEKCFGDSPCALIDSKREEIEAMKANMWCGANYKHLVEHCPKPCPSGSDDECGKSDDGKDMTCFNMSEEDAICNVTGVGVKDPVDPANLWCGRSWNDVLENCPKKCPEGTDEECGPGQVCYDLTGNDPMICKTEGFGVKKKGDPNKRFCGDTYNHMMEFCPMRCRNGDECPGNSICFEDSPCTFEGQSAPGFVKQDSTKMFCGTNYAEAATCGTPCPGGSNSECAPGQKCWADVVCNPWAMREPVDDSSNMMIEVTVEVEGSDAEPVSQPVSEPQLEEVLNDEEEDDHEEGEPDPQPKPAPEQESKTVPESEPASEPEQTKPKQSPLSPEPEPKPAPEPEQSKPEPNNPPAPVPKLEAKPAPQTESDSEPQSEPRPSPPANSKPNPQPTVTASQSVTDDAVAPKPAPASSEVQSGVAVDNLRMAIYGLTELSAAHVLAWESWTAAYFEGFYNDASTTNDYVRDSTTNVATDYDLTSLNLSSARRRLRAVRQLQDSSAFLLTYMQTLDYSSDGDTSLKEILQHPFQNSAKRSEYVDYLKAANPELFGGITSVSAVFLPEPLEPREVLGGISGTSSPALSTSAGNHEGYPPASLSNPTGTGNIYSKDFYCHNSGDACPSGECPGGDLCMFVPDRNENEPIAPFVGHTNTGSSPDSAANLISSALDGSFLPPPTPPAGNNFPGIAVTVSSNSNNPPSSAAYGPAEVSGLQMKLVGLSLRSAKEVSEWQYLTAVYEQSFYNDSPLSQDQMRNNVYAVATALEATAISYEDSSSVEPSTTFVYKQTIKFSSIDTGIGMKTVATHPFSTPEYRGEYAKFLKDSLPDTFRYLSSVPNVGTVGPSQSSISLADAFFCSSTWPVQCSGAQSCLNDSDCPSAQDCVIDLSCESQPDPAPMPQIVQEYAPLPQSTACNLCRPNQVGINAAINFNGRLTDCAEAYDYMARNYDEADPNCDGAKAALSSTCCGDAHVPAVSSSGNEPSPNSANRPIPVSTPVVAAANDSPSSPTKITVTVAIKDEPSTSDSSAADLITKYPSNTYFCGTSHGDAADGCQIPCPSSNDDECPGDLNCYGNTECMNRESFYCGTSWLDASDKCSKPCPTGDALECDMGEACFAWTSCHNTESFYCGVSFEDASSNCAKACPSRSSRECDDGQGCFAYTTCKGESEPPHEVNPSHVPMNDYFCGESKSLASSTCSIACQSGLDSECPGSQKCYEGTGCSNRDSFWCGSDWLDAAEKCTRPCSSGSSDECGAGESCFAHTGCQANLFFCGDTFDDASESCSTPCESRSSSECPGNEKCFAFVTACASSEVDPSSSMDQPTTGQQTGQSYSMNIANTRWDLDGIMREKDTDATHDHATNNGGADDHHQPDWYTQWVNYESRASSSPARSIAVGLSAVGLAMLHFA